MSDDIDTPTEIRLNLKHNGITKRKLGREGCNRLLKKDANGDIFVLNSDWNDILEAAIDGAIKETEDSLKKGKIPDIEIAVLIRKLVKHIIHGVIFISLKKIELLVKLCLQILNNQIFPTSYKDEYRSILCETLLPKVSHSLSFIYFVNIFQYLKDVAFQNKRNALESTNLRLLKHFCRALFMDESRSLELFESLLVWFSDVLLPMVSDDSSSQAAITATAADCISMMIQYQGLNCAEMFYINIRSILSAVIRQLSANQLRDSQRDSYLRFLNSYIILSRSINACDTNDTLQNSSQFQSHKVFPPLSKLDPMYNSLGNLCDVLTADDCLRALVVYAYNHVRQSQARDSYVNLQGDIKVRSNLQITAMAVVLHQQQFAYDNLFLQTNSDRERSRSLPSIIANVSSSSSSSNSTDVQSGKRSHSEYSSSTISCPPPVALGYADLILQKITSFNLHSSSLASQTGSSSIATAARHMNSGSLEGLIILLATMARLYPKGDFLVTRREKERDKTCDICDLDMMLIKLSEWIMVLTQKLYDTLQLLGEQQLQGSILLALNGLAVVTAELIGSVKMQLMNMGDIQSDSKVGVLLTLWTEVMSLLVEDSFFVQCLSVCKKNSRSECAYRLMFTLISNGLLEMPSQLLILRKVLSLPAVKDPRTVDSPVFFLLISTAIAKSDIESPDSLCALLLNRMAYEEYTTTDDLTVSKNSELLKNNGPISITQCLHTAFSGYSKNEHHLTKGVAYVASWLDYQLDAPSSARMSSLVAGDFAHGINRILATTLQHSLINGNILNINFFPTSLFSIE